MKHVLIAIVCFVFLVSSFSCYKVTKINLIGQIKEAPKYEDTLEKWTKKALQYQLQDIKFEVWSTYKSWPLRMAYMKEYARKFKLSPEDQLKMYTVELADYNNNNDFFVTIFSYQKDMNDLTDNEKWKLYLTSGNTAGSRLNPESIKEVDIDSSTRYFYPHINPWTRAFDVRFSKVVSDATVVNPVADQFSTLSLMIASLTGEHTFAYGVDTIKQIDGE